MLDNELINFQINSFGENYLYAVNRDTFSSAGSQTVFQNHFAGRLFEPDRFYIIAGTDGGLLINYIINNGLQDGSRYLFIELPEIAASFGPLPKTFDNKLTICTPNTWQAQAQVMGMRRFAYRKRVVLEKSLGVVNLYCSKYVELWRQLKSNLQSYIWQVGIVLSSQFHVTCRINNLTENLYPASSLKNAFAGQSALLLAGGPSLNRYLPWVKEQQGKCLIVAVSRISKILLEAGITPDIIVSIDPYPVNLLVSKEVLEFQEKSLLVNSAHISPKLLTLWGHRKLYLGERFPWKSAMEPANIPTVGQTVTNAAHTMLVEYGVKEIVLVGVNLCFSSDGYTHAKGTLEQDSGPKLMLGEQRIVTNSGAFAETNNAYYKAAQELEEAARMAIKRGCLTINVAPDAIKLEHVAHTPIQDLKLTNLPESAANIINRYFPSDGKDERSIYFSSLRNEINRVLQELRSIQQHATNALNINRQMQRNPAGHQYGKLKNQLDNIEKLMNGRYADTCEFVKKFDIQKFISIVRTNEAKALNHAEIEQYTRTYYQAYIETTNKLAGSLEIINSIIDTRIMEDQQHPDINDLVKRWQSDKQPGRAIGWRSRHRQYATSEYDPTFAGLENHVQRQIDWLATRNSKKQADKSNLHGVQGKAMNFLLNRDTDGLHLLLHGLAAHPDNSRAEPLYKLVQAHILELQGKDEEAIILYKSIKDTFTFDILKRILALQLKAKKHEQACDTLTDLCRFSPTFLPYLADLQHLLGNTERAVEIYTDYLLKFENDLQAMFKLGKIYQQAGVLEGVQWTTQYILSRDPNNKGALSLLAQIQNQPRPAQNQIIGQ